MLETRGVGRSQRLPRRYRPRSDGPVVCRSGDSAGRGISGAGVDADLVLNRQASLPGSAGHARTVTAEDALLFADWMLAFQREAVPHDPVPSSEDLLRVAGEGNYMFWIYDGRPVSMAGIRRRLRNAAAIAGVYTPAELRCQGYAGSVTAAAVERIHSEGRNIAYLYTDLRDPASNRCYAKIGFTPVCKSMHFHRQV
jgi:predicted GNAT family acetyltransferase